jgi:uncharacterized protein with von Willebrand factor type A (vWA) domain
MGDPQTLVRLIDEFLWVLRRVEFVISTAQAIDVARAVQQVGLDDPAALRGAVACIVVSRATDRPRFDAAFDAFFATDAPEERDLWRHLTAGGFLPAELEALRGLFRELASTKESHLGAGWFTDLLRGGAERDRVLAFSGVAARIDAESALQIGFETHRLLRAAGLDSSGPALAWLRSRLIEALGTRGGDLADAVGLAIDRAKDEVRSYVCQLFDSRTAHRERDRADARVEAVPFSSLSESQIEEVRRAVRRLADRLRGRARVRARRNVHGGIDVHRVVRESLRTFGIPIALRYRRRRRSPPRFVLLCDVSDSVRGVARFILEFAYATQDLFDRGRTFVFVSDLGEATDLFRRERADVAVPLAWRGAGTVRTGDNSNYGRVLRAFARRYLREIDHRTTVVILGDGRANYHDPAPEVLDSIRARARSLYWLCPESRGQWTQGDSVMRTYAPRCTAVFEMRCAADIERVARRVLG